MKAKHFIFLVNSILSILILLNDISASNRISFVNKDVGWILNGNKLFKTLDGGENWKQQKDFSQFYCASMCFTDSNCGYIVGGSASPPIRTILKTIDGGDTWNYSYDSSSETTLLDVYFVDENTGYAVGVDCSILKTTNAGDSWIKLQDNFESGEFHSIYFSNADTGWIVGYRVYDGTDSAAIYYTHDGGRSWSDQLKGTKGRLFGIAFSAKNIGFAIGQDYPIGKIFRTTDGGQNWIDQKVNSPSAEYLSIFFINPEIGWAVGDNGMILKTEDMGNHWVQQSSGTKDLLRAVYFPNLDTGFVVGFSTFVTKTYNGGVIWEQITSINKPEYQLQNRSARPIANAYDEIFMANGKRVISAQSNNNISKGVYFSKTRTTSDVKKYTNIKNKME